MQLSLLMISTVCGRAINYCAFLMLNNPMSHIGTTIEEKSPPLKRDTIDWLKAFCDILIAIINWSIKLLEITITIEAAQLFAITHERVLLSYISA